VVKRGSGWERLLSEPGLLDGLIPIFFLCVVVPGFLVYFLVCIGIIVGPIIIFMSIYVPREIEAYTILQRVYLWLGGAVWFNIALLAISFPWILDWWKAQRRT